MRTTRVAAGVALAASSLLAAATPAAAWPVPSVLAAGGACTGSMRSPVTWSATNLENVFPSSPAHFENVVVTPAFPTGAFSPATLPNTGTAQATTTTAVPPTFTGDVTLTFRMVWSGPDGADQRDGTATVHVQACPQSPPPPPPTTTTTTTTTTTVPVTTTTLVSGTPQQQQATTTTTTTVPSTTTTTTTVAVPTETETDTEAQPTTAVKAVAVTATPTFTG